MVPGKKHLVPPGQRAKLSARSTDDTGGIKDKSEAQPILARNTDRLVGLSYLLYAEGARSLLIVLQGMDTSGKDGTISHVMSGVNPQSCSVTSFKVPSEEERKHDFLWRIHKAVPRRGAIGIFNRSHYEDVLVVRVHGLVPKAVWAERYEQINAFERGLVQNDVHILKFFLHISKDEQKRRLQDRLDDPTRNWKFSPDDLKERKLWDDYMEAYEDALTKCSTPWAPWYVIPSDHKWHRNLAISHIVVETLTRMRMKLPKPEFDLSQIKVR
jgi:PPK2 family polyphosphate:nucleotide phosphotransferase